MWVPTADLPKSAGHPFYERLNRVLDDAGFDAFVEPQCASFYADGVGRPSLAPGRYFRLLLLGYFEGLDSQDGRTHLAHTAEHAVDRDTGAIVGVTVQDACAGDTTTLVDTLVTAAEQVEAVGAPGIAEIVADKGYHSNETMVGFAAIGVRSYVSEPDRGRRHWKGQAAARDAVYANRRRIRGARGKRLLRQRGELLERPNAHLYETGRMRRVHLRGHPNILKRLLVQVCGVNLGLLMQHLTGVGTPRSLQGRASALVEALIDLLSGCWGACAALGPGACARCRSEARSEPRSSGFPGGRGCDPSGRIGCDRRPLSRSQAGAASAWRSTGAPRRGKADSDRRQYDEGGTRGTGGRRRRPHEDGRHCCRRHHDPQHRRCAPSG